MTTIFNIIGSLGLFLFGMKLMSECLQRLSGERLRSVMHAMTGNRFKGVASGLIVTTCVQSSSATTVMVVSFVNAGLLTLREAIGVIMGANLGTTATAWIIALLSFKFSLADIALPAVGVGVLISFFNNPGWRSTGELIVGFGLLFMGLDFLKNSVPDINKTPEVLEWIAQFSSMGFFSVLIFFGFGILLTLVVQSSSVAMAITITMAAKGWISYDLAAAIVLGENIGTTVTALIASIPASLNARRAAIAHLTFNVLGVLWMLSIFYYFTSFIAGLVPLNPEPAQETLYAMGLENFYSLTGAQKEFAMEMIATPTRLALFHSMFNLINICLLIGFVPQIEKIACFVLKDKKGEEKQKHISFLPSNAPEMSELILLEGQKEMAKLATISGEMFTGFVRILNTPDEDLGKEVSRLKALETESDRLLIDLTKFFIDCSSHDLSKRSLKIVTRNMIIVPELEGLCDSSYKLIKLADNRYSKQLSDEMLESKTFAEFCTEMSNFVEFADNSLSAAEISEADLQKSEEIHKNLNKIRKNLRRESISHMETSGVSKGGILFIEMLSACERVNSHAMNILEAMNTKVK